MKNVKHFENFFQLDSETKIDTPVDRKSRSYKGYFDKWVNFEIERKGVEKILRDVLKATLGKEFDEWVLLYYHDLNSFSVIMPPVDDKEQNDILARKIVGILAEYSNPGKISLGPVTHEGFRILYS